MKLSTILTIAAVGGVIAYFASRTDYKKELKEILIDPATNDFKKELTDAEKIKLRNFLMSVSTEEQFKELQNAFKEVVGTDEVNIFDMMADLLSEEDQLTVLKAWQANKLVNVQVFELDEQDKAVIQEFIEKQRAKKAEEEAAEAAEENAEENAEKITE